MMRRLASIAWLLLVSAALPGCKDGDTFPGQFDAPTPIFVTAYDGGTSNDYVTIECAVNDCGSIEKPDLGGRITLAVRVHDVATPVSGIALSLSYPTDLADFQEEMCRAAGDWFPADALFECGEPEPGRIVVGRSIARGVELRPADGDETVVHLEFVVFREAAGEIDIERQNVGGDGSVLFDEDGDPIFVDWFGGTLIGG